MKKLIIAIMVIVITGAFEQRAAMTIVPSKPTAAVQVLSGLDSLSIKVEKLNNSKVTSHEK